MASLQRLLTREYWHLDKNLQICFDKIQLSRAFMPGDHGPHLDILINRIIAHGLIFDS